METNTKITQVISPIKYNTVRTKLNYSVATSQVATNLTRLNSTPNLDKSDFILKSDLDVELDSWGDFFTQNANNNSGSFYWLLLLNYIKKYNKSLVKHNVTLRAIRALSIVFLIVLLPFNLSTTKAIAQVIPTTSYSVIKSSSQFEQTTDDKSHEAQHSPDVIGIVDQSTNIVLNHILVSLSPQAP